MDHFEYIRAVLASINAAQIRAGNYRILFDPVNGSAVETGEKLLAKLGKVVMINDRMGQKPLRPAEPRAWTLAETARQVVKNHCDLGIATDVDADRVLFIDETGYILSEDLTAAILVEGKIAVTPVNSSGLFKAECKRKGIKVKDCRVGPPEIIGAINQYRADFAYEESGKYFFCAQWPWADGLLAGAKLLNVIARRHKKLSQIRKDYPEYFQVKLAIACPWEKMPKKFIGAGYKLKFGGSFLFIRASGTEPLIRVFSDSPHREKAEELAQKGRKMVNDILGT